MTPADEPVTVTATPAIPEAPAAPTPLALLQTMIEKGIDPSALEKMMDLSERWQRGEAEKVWNSAMARCQAEWPRV